MRFDHVIVGGGSAGCVLAARLSEDAGTSVCLIEAGGGGDGPLVRIPGGTAAMVSGRPRINNWAFHTTPQPGLGGRRGFQPRGRCLGGSSARPGRVGRVSRAAQPTRKIIRLMTPSSTGIDLNSPSTA